MSERKTNYFMAKGPVRYAKVFYDNRDMGKPGTDVDYSDIDGQYQVEVLMDDEAKQKMIDNGVPEVSLGHNQFKKDAETGLWAYRFKRPHQAKADKGLKDEDGNPVVFGPPIVFDYNKAADLMKEKGGKINDHVVPWDMDTDGLIGIGSEAYVTYTVYANGKKRIVRLEKMGIYNHVPYVPVVQDGEMQMF